jgi:class 3 adenylate cyclase
VGDTRRDTHITSSGPTPEPIFGDALRELRHAAGLTQAELAERANLSPRGLSDLERGVNRHPRRETLLALADAFQLSGDERERFFTVARRARPLHVVPPADPSAKRASASAPATPTPLGIGAAADIQVFLITDVRGYTTYTYEHRDEDAAALTLRFAETARAAIEGQGGRVVELRGDEVMAVFASARAGLRAAVELQQRLAELSSADPDNAIHCGIGLEAGEAVPVEDGYRGLALNLAARLCSRAAPGEILAGETVIALARRVTGLIFRDRGLATLKGFATPVHVIQVLPEEDRALEIAPARESDTEPPDELALPMGNFLWARPEHQLVARHAEMQSLGAALDAVQGGAGRVVFLVGEPGVGKTRLAQEVTEAARARKFFVVTGRCYAPQETVPYYPFLEALSRAYSVGSATVRNAVPQQWPEVARLVPDRNIGIEASSEGPSSGSAVDQQRLFWHVTGFLQALAAVRPLALLLDDLHWMDGASLALLTHLAHHTRESPILILGTYRDVEVQSTHPLAKAALEVSKEHLMERIEVRRLPQEGTAELLAATLEEGEVADALAALIHGSTEGNAFFAQEALRALVERGDVALVNGRWELRSGIELVVPESVRATVLERVTRLGPAAQHALALASVLGQTFRFDDLLATGLLLAQAEGESTDAKRDEAALEGALEEAVVAQVLREGGGESYTFSHALAQRAVYDQIRTRRRKRIHLVAAETLAALSEKRRLTRTGEIAYHYIRAEEGERALPYALLAGDQAQAVYANAESENHYRTAARLAHEAEDHARESVAFERLGALLWWNVGDYSLAKTALEQAATAQRASTGSLQPATAALLARSYARSGQGKRGWELLAPWLDEAGQIEASAIAPAARAALYTAIADIYVNSSPYPTSRVYEPALDAAERAAATWRTLGAERFLADSMQLQSMATRLMGRWDDGMRLLHEVGPLARSAGMLFVSAHASYHIGYAYLQSGQWIQAAQAIGECLELAEQAGNMLFQNTGQFLVGLAAWYSGEWREARRHFELSMASFAQQAPLSISTYGPLGMGMIQAVTGDVEVGLRHLHDSVAHAESVRFIFGLHRAQRETAEVELALEHYDEARARLEPLVTAPGCETYSDVTHMMPQLAWALLELGEEGRAEALLKRTEPQAIEQHHMLALVDLLRVRGILRTRQGRCDEAQEALEGGLAHAHAMPYPYAEVKLLYAQGQLAAAQEDHEAAHARFEEALAICSRLDERLYAERIERALLMVPVR